MKTGTTAKQCWGYVRVSSNDQAEDGISLDAQKAKIATWAKAHDYQLVDVFADEGISGKRNDNRPALQRTLKAVCEVPGAAIICYSLSRLARSVPGAFKIIDQLDKQGANLVSLTEDINTTTAMGRAFFGIIAVLSALEREIGGERTKTALDHLKATGKRYTRIIPFGYRLEGSNLVEHAGEKAVIAEIVRRRLQGETAQAIADDLTSRRIPTRKGKPWNVATVWKLAGGKRVA